MGDHIVANGMVRTIAKEYDKVYVFCKPRYIKNVTFMYRDLSKIKIIALDDIDVRIFIKFNPNNNYLIAGHAPFMKIYNSPQNTLQLDEIFYQLAGVPFENKWKEFYLKRDMEREKELFNSYKINEPFIFVHDDDKRKITKELPSIKIIHSIPEISIFDYLYIIENAQEVHVINSSFFVLIDCMNLRQEGIFMHRYAYVNELPPTGKFINPWKIIN